MSGEAPESTVTTSDREEWQSARDEQYRGGLKQVSGQWFDATDLPSEDEL